MNRRGGRRVTLRHRGEALLLWGMGACIRVLPEGVARALGAALGWTAGVVFRIRYRVVLENLARAFPQGSPGWRRRMAASSYAHVGREGVALLRLASHGPREVWDRTDVEGLDVVREALSRNQGVIILTGHFGNWEIGGASMAVREIPLDVVGRRQSNPLFDRRLRETRERLGMRVIYRDEGVRPILRALREPRAVALVADQHVREGGLMVDFFGVPAATTRGPATLARRTGAQVVVGTARSLPGHRARYHVRLRALETPDTGDPEQDERALLRSYLAMLEEEIRSAPAQYFWPHRRWKAFLATGPEEPTPGESGTTDQKPGIPGDPGIPPVPGQDKGPEPENPALQ